MMIPYAVFALAFSMESINLFPQAMPKALLNHYPADHWITSDKYGDDASPFRISVRATDLVIYASEKKLPLTIALWQNGRWPTEYRRKDSISPFYSKDGRQIPQEAIGKLQLALATILAKENRQQHIKELWKH